MEPVISYDFSNVLKGNIGKESGLAPGFLDDYNDVLRKGHLKIENGRGQAPYSFMELPYADVSAMTDYARQLERFKSLVVVGIGGSALGASALFKALRPRYHNMNREKELFFIDNSDPETILDVLEAIEPSETVFDIVTKSGSTAETMSAFSLILAMLKKNGLDPADHVIVTTDREKGDLTRIAKEYGLDQFDVPEGVGGRYSVFTSVGLLPAVYLGIDINELLDGAKAMDSFWRRTPVEENPVAVSALLNYVYHTDFKRNVLALMCYKDALKHTGLWYQQLWAESLGKRYDLDNKLVQTGATPVVLRGATDQHSVLQLFMDGPDDKLFVFLDVREPRRDNIFTTDGLEKYKSIAYFKGKTSQELISAELAGVKYALAVAGKPSYHITLQKIDEYHIGALFYALQLQTVLTASLYNVNPFDQPGVEEGKRATYAIMGREGYDEKRREMEDNIKADFVMEVIPKQKGIN